jgi:hypothetical protein
MRKAPRVSGDKVRKILSDRGISLAAQFVLASLAWLFSEFFAPSTASFWLALVFVVLSIGLIWYRHYFWATGIVAILIAYMTVLATHATYVLATDQSHTRLRTVDGISFLEVPASSHLYALLSSGTFDQKVISINSCGGLAVAKLPLLPYARIRVEGTPFHSPVAFRRLPMLAHKTLMAYVETVTGKSDANEKTGLGFRFSADGSVQAPLTDLFPRTFACAESSIPLIPVLEFLPWHPDQPARLISAVSKVLSFRSSYLHSQLTLEAIRALDMGSAEDDYKLLLDFVFNSLIFRMLEGNLFAEAKADILDRLCVLVESSPVAFSGPFAPMKELMYKELARSYGRKYKLAYPACHIEDSTFAQIEEEEQVQSDNSLIAAMQKCESAKAPRELRLCMEDQRAHQPKENNCDVTFCGTPISGKISDESAIRFYEKRFDDYVVSDGRLVSLKELESASCPKLQDTAEDLHMLVWRERRALAILNQPYKCSSNDWSDSYARQKASRIATLQCARQKGISVKLTDEESNNLFDFFYQIRCENVPAGALKNALLELLEMPKGATEFIQSVNDYVQWIGQERADEILKAATMIANLMQTLCGDREPHRCVADYGEQELLARYSKAVENLIGPIQESSDGDTKLKAFIETLARRNNMIINIAICDLLADRDISEKLQMSRDEFCRSHRLSRYQVIAPRSPGKSFERSFPLPGGTVESIETEEVHKVRPSNSSRSYERSWMRKFVPAQR